MPLVRHSMERRRPSLSMGEDSAVDALLAASDSLVESSDLEAPALESTRTVSFMRYTNRWMQPESFT